jgi:PPK2 family polyphosphate:nucleotide phosphotransferase
LRVADKFIAAWRAPGLAGSDRREPLPLRPHDGRDPEQGLFGATWRATGGADRAGKVIISSELSRPARDGAGMKKQPVVLSGKIKLKHFAPDYCGGCDKAETKESTDQHGRDIGELQRLLYANAKKAVLLIFQGMDASGKDGSIRTVLEYVNPTGVETANFKVPSDEERAHDFLWRIHRVVPRWGNIGVFNRSHYEAVLAERILGVVPRKVWQQRYRQIVDFERMLVENDTVVIKFYLHLSRQEQAERFEERLANPKKYWKFSHADITARQRWDDYIEAYEDMLNATSHADAPWHLVPADRNWYRDHVIASTVAGALKSLKMKWPKLREDVSKLRIE